MKYQQQIFSVLTRWRTQGVARPPARRTDVAEVEDKLQIQFPAAFTELYLLTDGMDEGFSDDLMIRFWPLAEVLPVHAVPEMHGNKSSDHEHLFLFADYSLSCHEYALRIDSSPSSGSIMLIGNALPLQIVPSFPVFLEYYLNDPQRLFGPTDFSLQ